MPTNLEPHGPIRPAPDSPSQQRTEAHERKTVISGTVSVSDLASDVSVRLRPSWQHNLLSSIFGGRASASKPAEMDKQLNTFWRQLQLLTSKHNTVFPFHRDGERLIKETLSSIETNEAAIAVKHAAHILSQLSFFDTSACTRDNISTLLKHIVQDASPAALVDYTNDLFHGHTPLPASQERAYSYSPERLSQDVKALYEGFAGHDARLCQSAALQGTLIKLAAVHGDSLATLISAANSVAKAVQQALNRRQQAEKAGSKTALYTDDSGHLIAPSTDAFVHILTQLGADASPASQSTISQFFLDNPAVYAQQAQLLKENQRSANRPSQLPAELSVGLELVQHPADAARLRSIFSPDIEPTLRLEAIEHIPQSVWNSLEKVLQAPVASKVTPELAGAYKRFIETALGVTGVELSTLVVPLQQFAQHVLPPALGRASSDKERYALGFARNLIATLQDETNLQNMNKLVHRTSSSR